ncbi:MAG TPA: hypothetical protein VGU67_01245 [Edaphobacter sp.]|nr:hypothetical protein [Edaphobacter sp.]
MIVELLEEMKTEIREFPWLWVMVLLTIVAGIDFNLAIFGGADSSHLQLSASHGAAAEVQMNRLRMQGCTTGQTPGFTVIVGLRRYSMELSVPVDGVRSLLEDTRMNISGPSCGSSPFA